MLVSLLWVLAIMSLVVVSLLHTATLDLRLAKNHGDKVQARYLALAGVEKAKALLYLDARDRRQQGVNHSGDLYDAPALFKDVELGRGRFRVFRPGATQAPDDLFYGPLDEESRLNVNVAPVDQLAKLPGMTPELAAAVVDYRDADSTVSPGGAEMEEYAALRPPYLPRDAPLRTLREMLLVHGMTPELFRGEDANANGLLDPEEDDGDLVPPGDNQDGRLDSGWSQWVTVASGVRNVSAQGEARVNVQEAGQELLESVPGISSDMARALVRARGQNPLNSLADLLDLRPSNGNDANSRNNRSTNEPTDSSAVISRELLFDIADSLTVRRDAFLAGRINVNTARAEVLELLPGVTPELAQAILDHRSSSGFYKHVIELLDTPGLGVEVYKTLEPWVTVRSETFRILSEGRVNSTGARARLQVTVRIGDGTLETLSYREGL